MKKILKLAFLAAVIAAVPCFTACEGGSGDPAADPDTQTENIVVTFEDVPDGMVAGPTSYGENLYSSYDGEQFTSCTVADGLLTFGLNEAEDWATGGMTFEFWNGGAAVSTWSIDSDPEGEAAGWWYTYLNQCSVYNTGADGSKGAGADGSKKFAVITGSQNPNDGTLGFTGAGFVLADGVEATFTALDICNTAYAYGCIVYGSDYCNSLADNGGWLSVTVRGFKADSDMPAAEDEILLADYRDGRSFVIDRWTTAPLPNISAEPMGKIDFVFDGSDIGDYGLNTPKYVCVDNLRITK